MKYYKINSSENYRLLYIIILINLKIILNKNKEYNYGSLQSREYNITFIMIISTKDNIIVHK